MINILLALIAVGALLYCVNLIPMDGAILKLIRVVVVVILGAVLCVLRALGLWHGLPL